LSVTQRADGDNIGSIAESAEDWLKGRLEFAWKIAVLHNRNHPGALLVRNIHQPKSILLARHLRAMRNSSS